MFMDEKVFLKEKTYCSKFKTHFLWEKKEFDRSCEVPFFCEFESGVHMIMLFKNVYFILVF